MSQLHPVFHTGSFPSAFPATFAPSVKLPIVPHTNPLLALGLGYAFLGTRLEQKQHLAFERQSEDKIFLCSEYLSSTGKGTEPIHCPPCWRSCADFTFALGW